MAFASGTAMYAVAEKVGLQLLLEPQTSGVIFRAACSSVGVVVPAYMSYKAIEDKVDKTADEQWLTYWVIYGALSLLEGTTDQIVSKVPYYWHGKFALLLWLQLPSTQGAKYLYTRFVRPNLSKYEPKIDICIKKVGSFLMALYSIYKVPIDGVASLTAQGWAQLVAFLKWFSDGNSKPPVSGPGSTPSVPSFTKAQQFVAR